MDTNKELFLLARMNVLQAVTANLSAVMHLMFAPKGIDLLAELHHNLKRSMTNRAVVTDGDTDAIDPLAVQAMMLKDLDEFFRQARTYAEINSQKNPAPPPR